MKLTPFQKAIIRRIEKAGGIPVDDNPYGSQVLELLFGKTFLWLHGDCLPSGEFYYTLHVFPGRRVFEAMK